MIVYIYGLSDPRNDQLRYVGATINLQERYYGHINDKRRTRKVNWIKSLKKNNLKPEMFVIEEVDDSVWEESERFWIAYFRYIGADLTNLTDGGDKPTLTKEQREKLSAQLRVQFAGENNPFFGKHHEEEAIEKNRAAHLGKPLPKSSVEKREKTRKEKGIPYGIKGEQNPNWGSKRTDEQRKRMSDAQKIAQGKRKGIKHTPEHNAKISAGNTGRVVSQETRDKISVSNTGKTHTPETREKLRLAKLGKPNTPEAIQKQSDALRGQKQTPEHIANATAARKASMALKKQMQMQQQGTLFPM